MGIHSGSVIAGIVGIKKFAYDTWGDTFNTAARMEQNSLPGKINISQSTYELVNTHFRCEYKGEITAKNKGALNVLRRPTTVVTTIKHHSSAEKSKTTPKISIALIR